MNFIASAASFPVDTVLAVFSVAMTSYFWLVKARQERPKLSFFQMGNYRVNPRRGDADKKTKRLCISQLDTGGVLVANNSTRQNSIVRFDCSIKHEGNRIKGQWGWTGDDKPPWNIPPETTIAFSPCCFFEVPEDYEVPEDLKFQMDFCTVSGHRFSHTFSLEAPEL